ncbi:DNA gyrase inhibitor YacG [Jannaschia sp. Os4]|uniref:DNA gyrase inhibitor YacG n=1 Tax=Jannaschia sp. Os4 TaxID=2807617 RepID=UPI00193A1499|nr:DNA gyrase inhibitor YacG [Jannaschia sp. Os4]MBM2576928.1 DNA gyrase inhibitor YacG [Jannaschia sp. Os4]
MSCPICDRETVAKYRPFCSARCADVDLGKWVTGAYAIPSSDPADAEEAADEIERRSALEDPPKH